MASRATEAPLRLGHPVLVSSLVLAVSAGAVLLALAAFAACDVGINQRANLLSALIIGLPVLLLVNALAVWGVGAAVRHGASRSARPDRWALAAQIIALLVSTLLCWWYVATPSDYPSPRCPDNVPSWAPSWLPS